VVGLRFVGILKFAVPSGAVREARPRAPWYESLGIGMAFGVAACPACTPLLLAVLLGAIATKSVGLLARLFRYALRHIRLTFLRVSDPVIVYDVMGSYLLMPFSHQLPYILQFLPEYTMNVARGARHVQAKYPSMSIVDIGANVGDTLAIIRNAVNSPVLCIEGEARFFALLERNARTFDDVQLEQAFVGDPEATSRFDVQSAGGTAQLSASSSGSAVAFRTLSSILHDHHAFEQTFRLLKIDTDGFDVPILLGSLELLRSRHPVIFFEYSPFHLTPLHVDGVQIFRTLREAIPSTMAGKVGGFLVRRGLRRSLGPCRNDPGRESGANAQACALDDRAACDRMIRHGDLPMKCPPACGVHGPSPAAGCLQAATMPDYALTIERHAAFDPKAYPLWPYFQAPPDRAYRAEEVRIPAPAGHVLAGTLTLPLSPARHLPAVIMITGISPHDRDEGPGTLRVFRDFADVLTRAGIAVLRVDDRGVGQSTGDRAQMANLDEAADVGVGFDWLAKRPEIDPRRIAQHLANQAGYCRRQRCREEKRLPLARDISEDAPHRR